MANNVKPSEIIDIEGLIADVVKLENATGKYDAAASKMLDTLSKRVSQYRKEIQDLVKALSGQSVESDFSKQAKGLTEYKNALQGIAAAQERLQKSIDLSTASVNELKQRQKDLIKVNSALKSEVNQDTEAIKANEKALKETSMAVNQLTSSMKTASKQVKFAKGSYDELQQSLTNDIKALKSLEGAFNANNGKVTTNSAKIKELTANIKAKQTALKNVDAQMGVNTRNVGNYSSAIGFLHGGIRGAIGSMGTWGLAIIAVAEAMRGLNSLILVGEGLRRSQLGVENVSSSSLEASINLDFLRETAKRLGLEIESLNKDFKMFAGATEGTALEGAKTREIFDGIATAAAAMQLTVDDTTGMFRAFSQMISKNTLQSEELKGQLAERLPSAILLTAQALETTTEKLFEQMKAGKVLAANVLPLLAEKFQLVYSQEALKNADTLTGATNELSNAWKELLNEDTSSLRSFLTFMYKMTAGILESIKNIGTSAYMVNEKKTNATKIQRFAGLPRKEKLAAISMESEKVTLQQQELAKHRINGSSVALIKEETEKLREQTSVVQKMMAIMSSQDKSALAAKKATNDALNKANEEQQAKAEKEAEKARNKKLIEDRKLYQIELRENQAKEKEKLAMLEISNIKGLISDEDYAIKRLEVEDSFTNQRIALVDKFVKINSGLNDELRDDEARNQQDLQDNHLEYLKTKAKQLQEYYKQIRDEFTHTFDGMKAEIEADIKNAEAVNKASLDVKRISIEKQRLAKQRGKGGIKESEEVGFDIEQINIDIENIQKDTQAVLDIYMKADLLRIANKKKAISELEALEGTVEDKSKIRTDIETKDTKMALDLKYKLENELANKKMELSDKVTEKQLANDEKEALSQEEKNKRIAENIAGTAEAMSLIFNSINSVSKAYSDNRIASLEKQKDYEISLAGDNADSKARIEEKFQKKINEERLKQAKRDKANAIAQIILNTAIGISKVLGQTGIFGLAAWIPVAALGAIQLATAIATPLPEYAKGKKKGDTYEGNAIVGEKGAELVEKDGKMALFSEPSVTYVDPSTRVYTASETARILKSKNLKDDKLASEIDYNNDYSWKHSKAYLYNETMNRNFKNTDLTLLKRTLQSGIGDGFEKATIVINNSDGGVLRRKGSNYIKDNSRRSIYQ